MVKVGFVGCGEMGAPMAGHVVKSGKFEVVVFDVRPAATKDRRLLPGNCVAR